MQGWETLGAASRVCRHRTLSAAFRALLEL